MIAEFVAISDAEQRGRGHDRRTRTDKAADARRSGEPTDPARATIPDSGADVNTPLTADYREANARKARKALRAMRTGG